MNTLIVKDKDENIVAVINIVADKSKGVCNISGQASEGYEINKMLGDSDA